MAGRSTSLGVRVRLLDEPCLWFWEIVDRSRHDAVVCSSWASEWRAYGSQEELITAGRTRLASFPIPGTRSVTGCTRRQKKMRVALTPLFALTLIAGAATSLPVATAQESRPAAAEPLATDRPRRNVTVQELIQSNHRLTIAAGTEVVWSDPHFGRVWFPAGSENPRVERTEQGFRAVFAKPGTYRGVFTIVAGHRSDDVYSMVVTVTER